MSGADGGVSSATALGDLGLDDSSLAVLGDLNDDLSGVNEVVGQLVSDGAPIAAVAGAIYDLTDGNYEGVAAEGLVGVADIGANALGLPGIDGDVGVLTDLVDGNAAALPTDVETAGIETAVGFVGGTIGSVLAPAQSSAPIRDARYLRPTFIASVRFGS